MYVYHQCVLVVSSPYVVWLGMLFGNPKQQTFCTPAGCERKRRRDALQLIVLQRFATKCIFIVLIYVDLFAQPQSRLCWHMKGVANEILRIPQMAIVRRYSEVVLELDCLR